MTSARPTELSRARRSTLADVAREASVSITAASLVLRTENPPNITRETQERIRDAARRVGYVPNLVARDLRNKGTSTVGVIVDGIAEGPFAGDMIRGAQDVAWESGQVLMIVETGHHPKLVKEAAGVFEQRGIDRVIYAPYYHQEVRLPAVVTRSRPVLLNCFDPERRFASVVPDEEGGGRLATETLLAIRRRPVGLINLGTEDVAAIGRLKGYRSALEAAGLPFSEKYVVHTCVGRVGGGNAVDGYRAAATLLRRDPTLDLLFCVTDRMAMGAYDFLKETGRRVPTDVAVVGFDNQLLIAEQIRPPLTTIALPHYEMGVAAARLVLADERGDRSAEQVVVRCRPVRRDST